MNAYKLHFKLKLVFSLTYFICITASTFKSNVTLDKADEAAFFKKLRKSIQQHSSSEEEETQKSAKRSVPKLSRFGESLVSYQLKEAEESLKEELDEYLEDAMDEMSEFLRYKVFMTGIMHPLIGQYTVRAKKGTKNDRYCDFKYILVPREGTGNVAYIIQYQVIENSKKVQSEAKAGLKYMVKYNIGKGLSKRYPLAEKNIKMMIVFSGSEVALKYSKAK